MTSYNKNTCRTITKISAQLGNASKHRTMSDTKLHVDSEGHSFRKSRTI
jgi:hypothetical protein